MTIDSNTIISKIYETILDQSAWREALSLLAKAANAKSSVLMVTDDKNLHYECVAASEGWSRRNLFHYWRNFYALEADIFRKLSKNNLREFVLDYEFRARPSNYWEQPISVWMLETLGVRHRGGAGLHTHNGWMGVATLQFDSDRQVIDQRDFLAINGYFHHISKAVEIGRTITHTSKVAGSLTSALDRIAQGMIVVDGNNQVVVRNSAANQLLDSQDGIYLDMQGVLKIKNTASHSQLETLLTACRHNASTEVQLPPSPVLLARESNRPSYIAEATPIVDQKDIFSGGSNMVLLCVTDPVAEYKVSTTGLSKLYELTRTESIVTDLLVSGLSIKEISAHRNTAEDTVRTQVKTILSKTRTSTQVNLIRLAHVLSPPLVAG